MLYNKLFTIYDSNANKIIEFGDPFLLDNLSKSRTANFCRFFVDSKDNFYSVFFYQNRVDKYANDGKLLMKIECELPYTVKYDMEKKTRKQGDKFIEYESPAFTNVYYGTGAGIDIRDRIWVMAYDRQPGENEAKNEYLKFHVFDNTGFFLSKVPVPEEIAASGNIKLQNSNLYYCDTKNACVHQYRIVDN